MKESASRDEERFARPKFGSVAAQNDDGEGEVHNHRPQRKQPDQLRTAADPFYEEVPQGVTARRRENER